MIKIQRIAIKNFRQYKDVELNFEDDKGIFFFMGRNCMGKSNFLNALCWCLYEIEPFSMNLKQGESHGKILNRKIEKENQNATTEVSITIRDNDNNEYIFLRKKTSVQPSSFVVYEKNRGKEIEKQENPDFFVRLFLPKDIRQLFWFDGEIIKNIFNEEGFSDQLKFNVEKVCDISLMNTAIRHIDETKKQLGTMISQEDPKLKEKKEELDLVQIEKRKIETEIEKISKEKNGLRASIKKLEEIQSNYNQYADLIERHAELEGNIKDEELKLDDYKKELRHFFLKWGPAIYAQDALTKMLEKIKESFDKGKLPSPIKEDFINELLKEKKCICSTHIGEKEKKALKELLDKVTPIEKKEFLAEDRYPLNNTLKYIKDDAQDVLRDLFNNIETTKQKIASFGKKATESSEKMREVDSKDFVDVVEDLEMQKEEYMKSGQEIITNTEELKVINKKTKDLEKELESGISKQGKYEKIIDQREFLLNAGKILLEIKTHISNQGRALISNDLKKAFLELHWNSDVFDQVKLEDNYEVCTRKNDGSPTGELSNGEKKILGLSMMKALSALSGFDRVPIFIDGVLSNLDPGVGVQLLESFPKFVPDKQLFIFGFKETDTINFLRENVKKENTYELVLDPDGNTSVIKYYDKN